MLERSTIRNLGLIGVMIIGFVVLTAARYSAGLPPASSSPSARLTPLESSMRTSTLKSHNAMRKSDIVELAKAIEAYRNQDSYKAMPSTNNQVINLDGPNNPLASASFLATVEDKSIKGIFQQGTFYRDRYSTINHYTYQSDGTSYEVKTRLTDTDDGSTLVGTYGVKDGSQYETPPANRY